MNYTKWKAYCLGSEGYQIRKDNEGVPAAKIKEDLKERLTPIVERMGGSFETQRINAYKIAAVPELIEALKYVIRELDKANIIKANSIFMEMPNRAIAKSEGR